MQKKSKKFLKRMITLSSFSLIPVLVLVSCGAPTSNKYLTMVAEFNDLSLFPNPTTDEQKQQANQKINVHYSLLSKNKTSSISQWSYKSSAGSTAKPQGLTNQVDSSFSALYGNLANIIAYNLVSPASIFATIVSNYNKTLPNLDDRINLFVDDKNQPVSFDNSQFYKSMSNNLLIANNDTNIGFGISDLSFNFKELTSTGTIDTTKSIYDVRKNNTLFKNEANDITTDAKAMSDNSVNNRLSKIFAVTDINIYFRFYVAGVDMGSESPSRNQIVVANPVDSVGKNNKNLLDNAFKNTFNETLTSYAYKLTMQDMVATILYSANDIKDNPDKTQSSKVTYTLAPSIVQSFLPLSWLTNDTFTLVNGKSQPNILKLDSNLLTTLVDQSKILSKEQFQLANESSATPEDIRKTFIGHSNWANAQSSAFINQITNTNPSLTNIKNKILTVPQTSTVLGNQNNPLNFTIGDYYKSYFKALIVDNNSIPFVQDISKD
ncbi:hypothetical protein [Mycoplasmoides alvi]|uniref:hypothetical protein n=1 Tax=Mycoplasmoides alvi TaxID=78580 RepID=UPI00051B6260|nr:hypothetical protein [Mycoplasmoides alvi]